jgi:P27 family predicted phage terminase small subunit
MTKPRHPPAPKALSANGRRLWNSLLLAYAIDDEAGLLLLQTALEARDRMDEATAILKRDGLVLGENGTRKQHPACAIERDARLAMLACLKQLNLTIEPLHGHPGRPAGR